ncbi:MULTISPECIES: 1-(5-phosphoribosyl)-5-[(5-phosphoribosylamino)methylideneamino]imidazole-4-carboxamide isomerase [unclassified Candidatus Frackibacter]|uniref:1-(5-phosphoribosyl)-5-[(5- phosphoribosylamino)methylideneamino]imidazole-4- carboxamide isomerase n=1 Tax=unclassified Candidatus Frackibacter TaxID=2648818 RepID=UPI0008845547|nr:MULTISPECIES: 1-(5-phosphoribosyl)-5-[(5-phosphoribosylamino)methylideneamino]imidazole-4-carboxamide isomerase [unclassified Candidatus Frackibacter]SDC51414.1 1-(5-phosphoribosyl)-5-[(5-phosphoribosylamino)methylideneamino] imidazole-4-carboxamide isomerase [Candidatus Frackibacter sp. WG11]SEM40925.1 1-(5-phosphoribosyl)-5-[(5-phosphoribosylamino)methylideneamino] imidazole-4-carboxamide isomerase [Candidatus Frackibacter sp. WG12]SFL75446.1 1-(5-phosphoribosyl)-5-[(5-phosphoribosylamino)m
MEVIPAIDIRNGKCVRLYKGDFEQETVYGEPLEMAKLWADKGATRLHIVDLDGALDGKPQNLGLISEITDEVDLPVQVGGGIRDLETIKQYLEIGVERVIIGTAAIENPELVVDAIEEFGSKAIVVGIDAKDGYVATEGWLETSDTTAVELGNAMKERGVEWVVFTDISKDGTLSGPNIESTQELAQETELKVIASGGVSKLADIEALQKIEEFGVKGVITGKALYSGNLDLEDAIEVSSK